MALNLSVGWVVVTFFIVAILIVVALIKKRQSMATGVVTIVSVFIVLSMGYVFIVNNVQLNSINSIIDGTEIYLNWLLSFFGKASDVTSYAIKQDWTGNATTGK